jgi:hypothetical protein
MSQTNRADTSGLIAKQKYRYGSNGVSVAMATGYSGNVVGRGLRLVNAGQDMGLDELPTEVLLYVCEHLDTWQLLTLRGVCKRLSEVANVRIRCEITVFMETKEVQLGFDDCVCSEFDLYLLSGLELGDGLEFWLNRLNKLSFIGPSDDDERLHKYTFTLAFAMILTHIEKAMKTQCSPFVLDLSTINLSAIPHRKRIVNLINSSDANFKTRVLVKTDKVWPTKEPRTPCAILGPKFEAVLFVSDEEDSMFTPQEWFRFDHTSRVQYMCFNGVSAKLSTVERMLRGCQQIQLIRILFSQIVFDKDLNLSKLSLQRSEIVEVLDTIIIVDGNRKTNEPFHARYLAIEDLNLLQLFNYNFPQLEILTLRDRAYFDNPQSIYSTAEIVPLLAQLKELNLWLQDWSVCHLFKTTEFTHCSIKKINLLLLTFDLDKMLYPFKALPHLEYLSIESKSSFQTTRNKIEEYAADLLSAGNSFLQIEFKDPFRAITFEKNGKTILNGMPFDE